MVSYFLTELIFPSLYFLKALTFFKAIIVFAIAAFPEDAIFWSKEFSTANLVFTVTLSIYHFVINPTNFGVLRLKLPGGAQSDCTSQKIILLIPSTKILLSQGGIEQDYRKM